MRRSWIYPADGSEPYEAGTQQASPSHAFFMPDIQPYQSMITGEIINSRSRHREHLKQHGKIEIGNEVQPVRKQDRRDDGLKRDLHRVFSGFGH